MFTGFRKAVAVAVAVAALASAAMLVPNAMADTTGSIDGIATTENVQTKLEQGSLAYFTDKGSTDAVKVLTDATVTKYVGSIKIGDAKDATSIDNMIAAVKYIQACNVLRAAEKLPELQVTDTLMAVAMADADYAGANDPVSPKQFDVTENVTVGNDPFHVWFTMNNGKTSYKNILSKDFAYTGFGVTQNNSKGQYPVQLQSFSAASAPKGLDAGRTMSADAYLKDLEAWKSDPESSKPAVDKTVLQKLIEDAKKLHESDWPAAAWKDLQDKVAAAEKIVADTKATVEQVKKAAQVLSDAIKALTTPSTTSKFKDVDKNTPHYEDINWIAEKGITTGYPDDTFRGMSTVVRQDMAAFLYRLAGSPEFDETAAGNPFSDVTKDTPHYKEILWLASTKISTGYTHADGTVTFGGMTPVYRQDMAAFLHRLAQFKDKTADPDNTVTFKDVDETTPHVKDILWLGGYGISTGFDDGTFRGSDWVVRQDMAAFLHRTYEYVLDK